MPLRRGPGRLLVPTGPDRHPARSLGRSGASPTGAQIATHKHTGSVFAFTLAGRWKYAEYPEVNTAGSYLFEPAGSIHTLTVPADNDEITDVWFAIYGANLNYGPNGEIESVWDAEFVYQAYVALCEIQGKGRPNVIGAEHRRGS